MLNSFATPGGPSQNTIPRRKAYGHGPRRRSMEVSGYILPESLEWYLYDGTWQDPDFEGGETFVALHVEGRGDILYGHIFPRGAEYTFVPCRDTWTGPIRLTRGKHYIAPLETRARQTTLSKISKLKEEIAKLEAQESSNA